MCGALRLTLGIQGSYLKTTLILPPEHTDQRGHNTSNPATCRHRPDGRGDPKGTTGSQDFQAAWGRCQQGDSNSTRESDKAASE